MPPLAFGFVMLVILMAIALAVDDNYESSLWSTLATVALLIALRANMVLRGSRRESKGRGSTPDSHPG